MENFLICFRIAKRNGGVLYYTNSYNRGFTYSTCCDKFGEPFCDFTKTSGKFKYGKELSNEERKLFYNVKQ